MSEETELQKALELVYEPYGPIILRVIQHKIEQQESTISQLQEANKELVGALAGACWRTTIRDGVEDHACRFCDSFRPNHKDSCVISKYGSEE